jgi:hypothetical protein
MEVTKVMEGTDGPDGRMGTLRMNRTIELAAADRTVSRCVVCGSREVRTDEVLQRGWVLLAECPHCDHRWTQRLEVAARTVRGPVRVQPLERRRSEVARMAEVSSAA